MNMRNATQILRLAPGASLPAARRSLRGTMPHLTVVLPALAIAMAVVAVAIPDWIAPFTPTDMDGRAILRAPGALHLLGTDHLGRDVLSLMIYGARKSVLIGAGAVGIGLVIGSLIGLVTGYAGGFVDMAVMRLVDVWMSVPDILLAIILATALSPSLRNLILTIGLVLIPRFARVMRAQTIALKNRPFVQASRATGSSHLSVLFRHILPHCLSPILVMVTLGVGTAMLTGAALSFIGLTVIDDRPDWGFLLSQGRSYLTVAWWFATFPGIAITVLVISVNLLGEALRKRLDLRARKTAAVPP